MVCNKYKDLLIFYQLLQGFGYIIIVIEKRTSFTETGESKTKKKYFTNQTYIIFFRYCICQTDDCHR